MKRGEFCATSPPNFRVHRGYGVLPGRSSITIPPVGNDLRISSLFIVVVVVVVVMYVVARVQASKDPTTVRKASFCSIN